MQLYAFTMKSAGALNVADKLRASDSAFHRIWHELLDFRGYLTFTQSSKRVVSKSATLRGRPSKKRDVTDIPSIKPRYTEGCWRGLPCVLVHKANSDWLSENETLSIAQRWH